LSVSVPCARERGDALVKVIGLILSGILFLGGMVIFYYASYAPVGWEGLTFFSGIVAIALALAVPFHLLEKFD
jgi:hypothetical protein